MCTVTFMPLSNPERGFVLTDNRDESVNRPALPPKEYTEYGTMLYYPRDQKAGGTWFGVSQQKQVMTLMNGAFKQHKRRKEYKESRGIIVKKLVAAQEVKTAFMEYDLTGIEAFFGVGVSWQKGLQLFEMIWDGEKRFLRDKDARKPTIWSSAMLYSQEEKEQKEKRFERFLARNECIDRDKIWGLHHTQNSTGELGLVIDRGVLQTTSVSQFSLQKEGKQVFCYEDLISGYQQDEEISF